jgi:hypothetical protein
MWHLLTWLDLRHTLYVFRSLQVGALGARLLCKNKGDVSLADLAGDPAQSAADLAVGKGSSAADDDDEDDDGDDDSAAAAAAADEGDDEDEDADTAEEIAGALLLLVLCC